MNTLVKSDSRAILEINDCLNILDVTFRNPKSPWYNAWAHFSNSEWAREEDGGYQWKAAAWSLRQRYDWHEMAFFFEASAYGRTWRLMLDDGRRHCVVLCPSIEFSRILALTYFERLLDLILKKDEGRRAGLLVEGFSWREIL